MSTPGDKIHITQIEGSTNVKINPTESCITLCVEIKESKQNICDISGCTFSCKKPSLLKQHKQMIHDIDVHWHHCDQDGCDYKAKQAGDLKKHKQMVHDIDVRWHRCDQDWCDYKAKVASHLKLHKQNIHDIDVRWHHCDQDGCDYKAKQAGDLKQHKADVHDIGVQWHHCDQEGCNHKTKQASALKRHKQMVHDVDVRWHHCDQDGCDYKAKQASVLKQHKANVHEIDVRWHHCDQDGCDYKAKEACHLKLHKSNVHKQTLSYRPNCMSISMEECIDKINLIHSNNIGTDLINDNNYKGHNRILPFTCNKNVAHDTWHATPKAVVRGSGCPSCVNKTEQKLYELIKLKYPTVEQQFKRDWCKSKKYLPFDFCIPEINIIIELDGCQHFISVSNWKSPEETLINDKYKEKCANDNNYSVIRILQEDVWNDTYDWMTELYDTIEEIKNVDEIVNRYLGKNNEYAKFQ